MAQMQATNPLVVGLDIGFGVTKAVTLDQTVLFPSVCGHAFALDFQADKIHSKYPGDYIHDDQGDWFVGDLALSQISAATLIKLRSRTGGKLVNEFRLRMAKVALGKLCPTIKNRDVIQCWISTGLPVDYMSDASELKQLLMGKHHILTNTSDFIADVVGVSVMPQPYGTIYSQMFTGSGQLNPCHTAMTTGVCDVGTYTIDLALDSDGEYIKEGSGSVEAGTHVAQERIAAALERDYRQKPHYKTVDEVLRCKCVRAFGKPVDYTEQVNEAVEPIRSGALSLMADRWKAGKDIDVIYIAGGGADLVVDEICQVYPQAKRVEGIDPQLSNATGYLRYALYRANNS